MLNVIGWIGTGVMGLPMATHLIKAGYTLRIFNRTASKAEQLLEAGASFSTIHQISQCELVFTMLGYPSDVEQVSEQLLQSMNPGTILVDHTSSSPQLAVRIAQKALLKGVSVIDAPVSGGDIGAKSGSLAIMCGGEQAPYNKASEIMKHYASNMQLMGGPGAGQYTKLTNQIILTGNMIGMVEGLIFAHKAGLDLNQMIQLISQGAAGSASLKVLGPRIVSKNLEPGFYIEHFVKDLGLALEESKRMNLCLPGLSMVNQLYQGLMANGYERKGTQALIKALEGLNNVNISG